MRYKTALIEKIKSDVQEKPEEDERHLPDIPIPDYPLKEGMLEKV